MTRKTMLERIRENGGAYNPGYTDDQDNAEVRRLLRRGTIRLEKRPSKWQGLPDETFCVLSDGNADSSELLAAGEILKQDVRHIDNFNTLICNFRDNFSDLAGEWLEADRDHALTIEQIRDRAYQLACDSLDATDEAVDLSDYECEVVITVAVAVAVATAANI